MYGAILGDMIGSPYEFDMGNKSKKFPLFSERSTYTDDTVMTLAVAAVFLDDDLPMDKNTIRQNRNAATACRHSFWKCFCASTSAETKAELFGWGLQRLSKALQQTQNNGTVAKRKFCNSPLRIF